MSDRVERRNYRKVYARLWNSAEFQSLDDTQKLVTLYLLTGPQTNRVGLFRFSFAQAGEHLGKSADAVSSAFAVSCQAFGWEVDERAKVIWIPSWWSFNPVDNPKNLKGYLTDLNDLPRTALIHRFCRNLVCIPEALHALFDGWEVTLKPQKIGDPIPDRSTETSTETQTQTETEVISPALFSAAPPVAAFLEFPTVGTPTTWALAEEQVRVWQELYPNVNVRSECRKALAWIMANSGRKKTGKGMPKFLVNWLNRSVDDGRGFQRAPAGAQPLPQASAWHCPHPVKCPHRAACAVVSARPSRAAAS